MSIEAGSFSSDYIFYAIKQDDIDMAVVICPDYVVYRGTFHSGSLIMFTCNGIKIKDLTAGGKKETVTFERAIDDIIDIKCRWFQRVSFPFKISSACLMIFVVKYHES